MNIKLTNMLSDITGITGMKIIRAIVAGERNPEVLAGYRNEKCAKSETEIAISLEGHYKREHLFALKQALELYDFYDKQLHACDKELEALYSEFEPPDDTGTPPPAPRLTKRRKNQPHFDLSQSLYRMTGIDLTQVDGLDALTIQTILSEIGIDPRRWPTVKHFSSWLRLSPNNIVTGGRVKRRETQPTQNRANTAFRMAAQSLARSDSALGAFYRRIRSVHGSPVAITATAHKLACIVYHMLLYKCPYRDLGAYYYDLQQRDRYINKLKHNAAKLGFRLEPIPAA